MDYAVQISNLRKVYRVGDEKVIALDSISLAIKPGEICCILGTSGSGKSTLLNLLAGLEKPTRGEVFLMGKPIHKMDERQLAHFRQRYLGFVFQSYHLLPALTALENVSLPLAFQGVDRRTRQKQAAQMLSAVGLSTHLRHRPTQMSGGQQQRVGIARAFVGKPPLIFADEPTGNLDSNTTREVMNLMVELAALHQQTMLIVTHDQDVASYANKIVHIRDGCIESIENNS
ncbi:MAG TPA: ABC transporter ATP-binding protein [Syntrophomonadaceae bacterium]|jgi:putative ABC transport system ATP-binding protein|nr:ABC transporter ATP-binding protein [Syntrophomonadaceae bacterium]